MPLGWDITEVEGGNNICPQTPWAPNEESETHREADTHDSTVSTNVLTEKHITICHHSGRLSGSLDTGTDDLIIVQAAPL